MSDARYKVVVNHEEQFKVLPVSSPVPLGWRETGKTGSERDCRKYIEEVWTDRKAQGSPRKPR